MSCDPAESATIICRSVMIDDMVFPHSDALDTQGQINSFEADSTRLTRSRAYASPDPLPSRFCPLPYMPVARLATDLPGWPDRAGFAPAR